MKRFRAGVLTGFIACGLLCLNLASFAFSFTADSPAASTAASVPVDGDDSDDAGRAVSPLTAVGWNERVLVRLERRAEDSAPYQFSYRPSLVLRHSSLTWHFVQRAAAAPRAPAFRA